jgi:galactokinase
MNDTQNINELFTTHFGDDTSAFTVRAPGRVNLIGEHIDYNDGFVLPMAISLQTVLRIRPREDNIVRLLAADLNDEKQFSLGQIARQDTWIDYVQGVADELQKVNVPLCGFEGVVTSTVPMASGLSSSAALEVGACLAFSHLAGQPMPPIQTALLCQRAENKFVGVNSGIMDQMAVAACTKDHALLIDCRSLELEHVPFRLSEYSIVVTDSGAPRELASSAYNERRAQCEEGLAVLQRHLPEARSLRDISPTDLTRHEAELSVIVARRIRHVVEEIARTQAAVTELKNGNLPAFGRHMNDSHSSLARLYEVSSPELDWLTGWARVQDGVLGSRMTGAGFGGCTVTLIHKRNVADFMARQPQEYKTAMGRDARCWECAAEQGAQVLA